MKMERTRPPQAEVYLVDMQDKDPSEMGFKQFTNVIQETDPLDFSDLLAKKLML